MKKEKRIDYKKLAEVYEGLIDKKNQLISLYKNQLDLERGTIGLLNQVIGKLNADVKHEKFMFNLLSIVAIIALIFIILI